MVSSAVLLRVPGVGPVLLAEIARFEMTLDLLDERARPQGIQIMW
jgi:hypothetical protein